MIWLSVVSHDHEMTHVTVFCKFLLIWFCYHHRSITRSNRSCASLGKGWGFLKRPNCLNSSKINVLAFKSKWEKMKLWEIFSLLVSSRNIIDRRQNFTVNSIKCAQTLFIGKSQPQKVFGDKNMILSIISISLKRFSFLA